MLERVKRSKQPNQGATGMMRRVILGGVLVLASQGGWAADAAPALAAPAPAQPPAVVAPAADEALLKERIQARWQALIERNFDAAYLFETPAYRAIYTPNQFRSKISGSLDWRTITVKQIDYDGPDVAKIQLEVAYRYAEPEKEGPVYDMTQTLWETWLRRDGQWWHQQD